METQLTAIPQSEPFQPPPPVSIRPSAENETRLVACITRMAKGEETALTELYEACVNTVFSLVLRLTGDSSLAEEITIDTFMQAWRKAASYRADRAKPVAWLLMMARSRAIDAYRRRDQAVPMAQIDALGDAADPATYPWPAQYQSDPLDHLLAGSRDTLVLEAIDQLSPVHRQVLGLAYFRGLSHREIANHTALPLGTIKSHLRQAQLQLKALLTEGPFSREFSE